MWRYQYITRAMVEIALGEENTALLTLASLIPFCERCGRVMDRMYIRILTAVCYQRQNNARWQEEWMQALDAAHESVSYTHLCFLCYPVYEKLPLCGVLVVCGDSTIPL